MSLSPRRSDRARVQKGYYMLQYSYTDAFSARGSGSSLQPRLKDRAVAAQPQRSGSAASAPRGRKQLITLGTFKVLSEHTKLCMQKALLLIIVIYRHNHFYKRKYHYFQRWCMNSYRLKHDQNLAAVISIKDADARLLREALVRSEGDYRAARDASANSHIDEIEGINRANDRALDSLHRTYHERLAAQRAASDLELASERSRGALSSCALRYESAIAALHTSRDEEAAAAQAAHEAEMDTCRAYYVVRMRDLGSAHESALRSQQAGSSLAASQLVASHAAALAEREAARVAEVDRLLAVCDSLQANHRAQLSRTSLVAHIPKLELLSRLRTRLQSRLLKRRSFWTLWANTIGSYSPLQALLCRHVRPLRSLANRFHYIRKRESRMSKCNYYFNLYRRNVFYLRMSSDLRHLTARLMHLERIEESVERDVKAEMLRLGPRFDMRHLPSLLHRRCAAEVETSHHMTRELRRAAFQSLRLRSTCAVLAGEQPDHTSLLCEQRAGWGSEGDVAASGASGDAMRSPASGAPSTDSARRAAVLGAEMQSIRQLLEQHQRSYGAASTYISPSVLR